LHHDKVRRGGPAGASDSITIQAADNLLRATAFADVIERSLRHHLTIRWPAGNWRLHQPVQQLVSKWLRHNVGGVFYVWVKEGNGGPHSHFLIHLGSRSGRALRGVVIRGIRRLTGLPRLEKGAVQCRGVHSYGSVSINTARRAAYLCKGGDRHVRALLGLRKPEMPRLDAGKRSGVSQSLGVTARKRILGTS